MELVIFFFFYRLSGKYKMVKNNRGTGPGENAWHIEVDNNGGLYVMATLYNAADTTQPNEIPIKLDDTHSLPAYTYVDVNCQIRFKAAYLLKYHTSNGTLAWSKPLQGDVNFLSRYCDVQTMYMDASKNIHAIMGFRAGTHLDGMITVPSTYTTSYQYYLVKFNYNNGNMTLATPPASYNRWNKYRRRGWKGKSVV
jgi:hypothetical protein